VLSNNGLNTTTGSNTNHLNSPIHPSFVPSIVSSFAGPISPHGSQMAHNINNWTTSNVVLSQDDGMNTTVLSGLLINSKDNIINNK